MTEAPDTAPVDFATVNFFRDPALIPDPYPYFEFLLENGPAWTEPHHDVLLVAGYDEAWAVYNDLESFSSCTSVTGPFPGFPVEVDGTADISDLIEKHRDELPMYDQLPTFDPPKHTDHRALLMKLLTPRRLKENEEFMWRLADRQIEEFATRGSVELMHEFAGPFAMLVIADLLGVPEEDHPRFRERLNRPKSTVGGTDRDSMTHSPLAFLYEQFTGYVEDRRSSPREDVLTSLATATFPDGSTPEVIDVVRVAANLFAAGQETTVRLFASALQIIAERPDLQQLLRDDPSRIPDFIEEALRYESPVKGDFRLSKRPTKVAGIDIAAGTTVMLLNGAANRDPRRFECPAEFRIDRDNARQHLAFGRGVHSCPGGPLARAEARIGIERLLARMGDIAVSEEHHGPAAARRWEYAPTYILRGLQNLHLTFTPRPS